MKYFAIALTILAVFTAGYTIGDIRQPHPVVTFHAADEVTSYNDGFVDGQTDCQHH